MFTQRPHPFPLLLHLEWIVLGVVIVDILFGPTSYSPSYRFFLFILVAFLGVQGLFIPAPTQWLKYPYTAASLLLLALMSDSSPRSIFAPTIVVVMRSCLMFRVWGRLAVILLTSPFIWLVVEKRAKTFSSLVSLTPRELAVLLGWGAIMLYGLCTAFVLIIVDGLITERKNRETLALAYEQLRYYALRVENQATIEERNRIAREIHDSLGHFLTALNIQLETGLKLWQVDPDRAYAYLGQAKASGSLALQAVRESVATLRQDPLAGKSLQEAIGELCDSFQAASNISPQCHIGIPTELPTPIALTLYRIVQEALTNICKHAGINDRSVAVSLSILVDSGRIKLEVKDNGRGFVTDQNRSGFGLQGMAERVRSVGGDLVIESALEKGCRIFVQIPLLTSLLPVNQKMT